MSPYPAPRSGDVSASRQSLPVYCRRARSWVDRARRLGEAGLACPAQPRRSTRVKPGPGAPHEKRGQTGDRYLPVSGRRWAQWSGSAGSSLTKLSTWATGLPRSVPLCPARQPLRWGSAQEIALPLATTTPAVSGQPGTADVSPVYAARPGAVGICGQQEIGQGKDSRAAPTRSSAQPSRRRVSSRHRMAHRA